MKCIFKQLAILLVCLTSFFISCVTEASPCARPLIGWQLRPYAGFDVQWRHMRYPHGLGANLFKTGYTQGNIYAGLRVHDYFGFELGLEMTPTRTRTAVVSAGEFLLGVPPIAPPTTNLAKNRFKGSHLGIMGFWPVCDWFCNPVELLGYVGAARLKAVYQNVTVLNARGPLNFFTSTRTFIRRRNILKLGVGAQYTFGTSGLRFMFGYEGTRQFSNLRPQEPSAIMRLSMMNSIVYSVGIFITTP